MDLHNLYYLKYNVCVNHMSPVAMVAKEKVHVNVHFLVANRPTHTYHNSLPQFIYVKPLAADSANAHPLPPITHGEYNSRNYYNDY